MHEQTTLEEAILEDINGKVNVGGNITEEAIHEGMTIEGTVPEGSITEQPINEYESIGQGHS